ncbi:4974_t:CDS:2, partial [Funneliformis geosporum]
NVNTLTKMEVESTLTFIPTNKGKTPEHIILLVNKELLDYDQSFDVTENVLDKNNRNNADETEKDILADIHNNLTFTLTRVNTIEAVLNISSISSEQAKIINSNSLKDPIDEMDEDSDQNLKLIHQNPLFVNRKPKSLNSN